MLRAWIRLTNRIRRFRTDERGGIAIISCAFFAVAVAASALAIDVGSLYLERRKAQSFADLAAMAAAGDLAHAEAAARATLAANRIDLSEATVRVELGHYEANVATEIGARFQIGALPYNAVRVTLTKPGQIFFAKTFAGDCCEMTVSAMATSAQLATFSLGSRLVALQGGVINGLLSGLLGGNVSLSIMDYNALASANVGLFDFSRALATRLNLTAASFNDILLADATVGDVLSALATVTQANGNTTASAALKTMLSQSTAASTQINLSKLLSYGPLGPLGLNDVVSGQDSRFNVMDIVSASGTIANAGKMLVLNAGIVVPGVASITIKIAIGEPMQESPWAAVGQVGATLHTAQTRILIETKVGGSGALATTQVRLPIYINAASADGRLTNIACAADGTGSVTVAAKPAIASAAIGDVSESDLKNFGTIPAVSKATLAEVSLSLPLLPVTLLKIQGQALAQVTNTSETSLSFSQSDINNGTIKRASTKNIAETLVTSLLSTLSLTVQPLNLSLGFDPLVRNILAGVAAPLDNVVYTLLTTLGIRLGEVDVKVNGVRCGGSVLAG